MSTISHIVVGIPARNEEQRVQACIRSVVAAADALPGVRVTIVLSSDSCTDGTEVAARAIAAADDRVHVLSGHWRSAGGARCAAIAYGLDFVTADRTVSQASIWIATTDADTVVSPLWLALQLDHARRGAHAVAGIVDLFDDEDRTTAVSAAFESIYHLGEDTHGHVHGANLGVRADAYFAAGGFPEVVLAEDHALWNEVRRLGFRCVSPIDVTVSTSSRLRGRAAGGFADTIAAAV